MTYDIFIIVLLAAMMHAAWNAIVKGAADRTLTFGLVATGHMLPALMIAPFVPLPSPETVSYIIASTIIHWDIISSSTFPTDMAICRWSILLLGAQHRFLSPEWL